MLSPIRRLLVIASEDIGLAHPMAVCVVKACCDNAVQLGLPEARLPLAEAVIYLESARYVTGQVLSVNGGFPII